MSQQLYEITRSAAAASTAFPTPCTEPVVGAAPRSPPPPMTRVLVEAARWALTLASRHWGRSAVVREGAPRVEDLWEGVMGKLRTVQWMCGETSSFGRKK